MSYLFEERSALLSVFSLREPDTACLEFTPVRAQGTESPMRLTSQKPDSQLVLKDPDLFLLRKAAFQPSTRKGDPRHLLLQALDLYLPSICPSFVCQDGPPTPLFTTV